MADTDITKEQLEKEIAAILKNASLANTSTKKVIQKLEKKLGVDLAEKKSLIDQLVMDYVNNMDSDEDEESEEEEVVAPKKKKADDDEDEEEHDDSNDSDWGDDDLLLHGPSDIQNYLNPTHQEPAVSTSQRRIPLPNLNSAKKAIILKRVPKRIDEEDESEIFGKLTAKKLRRLPEEQRDSLMIEINQLFYEKCHGHPQRQMVNRPQDRYLASPLRQIQAKKIYRVKTIPNVVAPSTNESSTNIPKSSSASPNDAAANKESANNCTIM